MVCTNTTAAGWNGRICHVARESERIPHRTDKVAQLGSAVVQVAWTATVVEKGVLMVVEVTAEGMDMVAVQVE